MSYLESLAKSKFKGDIEKARAWLSENGKKGGNTGKKYLSTVPKKELQKIVRKGQRASVEARRYNNLPLDEKAMSTYLE